MSYQMSMAAVYWKHDRSSSGALYHLVTTYSVMKLRSELHTVPPALSHWSAGRQALCNVCEGLALALI